MCIRDSQQGHGLGLGRLPALFQKLCRGQSHIFQDGHVRKQVEMLEYHAHFLTVQVDVRLGVRDIGTFEEYFTLSLIHI